jgi:hypothetical protein
MIHAGISLSVILNSAAACLQTLLVAVANFCSPHSALPPSSLIMTCIRSLSTASVPRDRSRLERVVFQINKLSWYWNRCICDAIVIITRFGSALPACGSARRTTPNKREEPEGRRRRANRSTGACFEIEPAESCRPWPDCESPADSAE